MEFNEVAKQIQTMNEDLAVIRKKHMEELQEKFKTASKAFFEAAPEVQAVVWEQVVPYFNDGEPCEFRVGTPIFVMNGFDEDELLSPWEYEDIEGNMSFWCRPTENSPLKQICFEFSNVIQRNEPLMEGVFGSHARVYLTPSKIIAEEYLDHD